MEATWTKLKDESWGARVVSASKPAAGDTLTVKKKDGTASQVKVTAVAWSGNGVHLCRVDSGGSSSKTSQPRSRGTRTGCSCGSVEEYEKSTDCWSCRHDR